MRAHRGRESLRCGFEYYRAMPTADRQLHEAVLRGRLKPPTLAIGAYPVGLLLHDQLSALADDLKGTSVGECGHIVPLDRPAELAKIPTAFLAPH